MRKILFIIIIFTYTILIMNFFMISHGFTLSEQKNANIGPFSSYPGNYNNTISTTNETIYYVEIYSQFPGQPQMLTIPLNGSGFYMYPYWTFRFFSDAGPGNLTTYTIYINGLEMHSDTFSFTTSYSINMTSFSIVNVSIVLTSNKGASVWNYHMIPILHTTLANYYKSTFIEKPVYTVTQYMEWGAKLIVASILILLASYYVIYKTYVKKKELEPEQII
ncbi:MAG: hypothetical protein GPW18_00065 [Euryarchaeota archaeon]|nr:hypothetical protein [Euryarchaeota archaeon]